MNYKRVLSLCSILVLFLCFSYAIEDIDWLPLEHLIEANQDNTASTQEFEAIVILINQASLSELLRIPILSEDDAKLIIKGREPVQYSNEHDLRAAGLSDETIFQILPYISFRKPLNISYNQLIRYYNRTNESFDSPKLFSKTEMKYDNFEVAFSCLTNSMSDDNAVFNHSYYAMWKPENLVKRVILGKYNLSLGYGISYSAKSSFIRSYDPISLKSNKKLSLQPHKSPHKMWALEGIAAAISYRDFDFVPFYSNTKLNATIKENRISSIYPAIFPKEERKNTVTETIEGLAMKYGRDKIDAGAYISHNRFNKNFVDQLKTKEYMTYGTFFNATYYGTNLFGEYASIANKNGLVGGLSWGDKSFQHVILFRSYDSNFPTDHGNPFSSKSNFSNEKGLYYGLKIRLAKSLIADAYFDTYRHPGPRYFEKLPTTGAEQYLRLTYSPKNNIYRLKLHHKGYDKQMKIEEFNQIYRTERYTVTTDWTHKISRSMRNKIGIEYSSQLIPEIEQLKDGVVFYDCLIYRQSFVESITQVSIFSSQVNHYVYEYTLDNWQESTPLKGTDLYLYQLLKCKVGGSLTLQCKISHTVYKKKTGLFAQVVLTL